MATPRRSTEMLTDLAPWFAAEVRDGRHAAVLQAIDAILLREEVDEELVTWARSVRELVVSASRPPR